MDIPGYKLGREVEKAQAFNLYNALDIKQGKTVLVKVFNEALSSNQAFQYHFKEVTGRLVNKSLGNNILLQDAIASENACVIVTNFYPRNTQQKDGSVEYTEDRIFEIGKQLAASLSQLHKLDIVHGGVELSNIHFLDSGKMVLGPIALHRTAPASETPQIVEHSVQDAIYLAPEIDTGLTSSSDFYSLGVVLYELLVGSKPFNAGSLDELKQQKKDGAYLPLSREFAHLKPLFDGLLAPDAESRIASSDLFGSTLNSCLKETAKEDYTAYQSNAKSPGVSGPSKISTTNERKGKGTLVFGAAAAIAIVISIVVFMPSNKEMPQQSVSGEKQSPVVVKATEPPAKDISIEKQSSIDANNEQGDKLKNKKESKERKNSTKIAKTINNGNQNKSLKLIPGSSTTLKNTAQIKAKESMANKKQIERSKNGTTRVAKVRKPKLNPLLEELQQVYLDELKNTILLNAHPRPPNKLNKIGQGNMLVKVTVDREGEVINTVIEKNPLKKVMEKIVTTEIKELTTLPKPPNLLPGVRFSVKVAFNFNNCRRTISVWMCL